MATKKRSLAQRMKDRTRDVDTAVDYMAAGRKAPKIGGAIAPKPLKRKTKK